VAAAPAAASSLLGLRPECGITITSAATSLKWDGYAINLIDTPGHVTHGGSGAQFARARWAILVLCSVGAVQSQSMTGGPPDEADTTFRAWRSSTRWTARREPEKVTQQVREKLGADAVLMRFRSAGEEHFEGVVDLITMKAWHFDGSNGEKFASRDSTDLKEEAAKRAITCSNRFDVQR